MFVRLRRQGARADVFAEWLLGTFGGAAALGSGSGVLDVAGGRGDLCFELCCLRGVPTTTVDPRERRLNKRQARWLKQRRRGSASAGGGGGASVGSDGSGGEQRPHSEEGGAAAVARAEGAEAGAGEGLGLPGKHLQAMFNEGGFAAAHGDLLGAASLIIGMHPDQVAPEPPLCPAPLNPAPLACVSAAHSKYQLTSGPIIRPRRISLTSPSLMANRSPSSRAVSFPRQEGCH